MSIFYFIVWLLSLSSSLVLLCLQLGSMYSWSYRNAKIVLCILATVGILTLIVLRCFFNVQ
jgi:hypothetical protein